ncbi:phenol-soluble modulin beta [Staphylococcus auricularis]|uniref:Beta-class phenol-soluble modulin n=1 Tax=Staphylococcus auricularis TaxID=29379 RepID=A0AAP8PQC9_9STAP|nr:beta-class phenol-soluble modulin [Staphylococcus auricularis]MBM0867633.1 beta-class phenol-soluble modulin [Staphylococcus auricularis]MCG7340499.1 beta-class phenol-soluble modulin [Staphylococcus auricularis]MDC6326451.1 beta-class phenol-soluble modulin [Staphylococcus auricularis]MDN4532328.1 beta-class phenol-soluble modulin [Staphylococcus auricularis]PNZ69002.1 beta-class phenol-soluble modulin [Staphylococcus auricularis]
MTGLFDAIRDTVQAGIDGDGAKLGTSIVDIVEQGVNVATGIFGL